MKKIPLFIALLAIQTPQLSLSQVYGVSYSVEYNDKKCSKDYPILISVKNRTLKDLKSFGVELSATPKGYSTVIYKQNGYGSDKIIKKLDSEEFCFSFYNGPPYPGNEDQIENDRNLNFLDLQRKYGYDIASLIAIQRSTSRGSIRLDPKYSISDLNIYISKEYSNFD